MSEVLPAGLALEQPIAGCRQQRATCRAHPAACVSAARTFAAAGAADLAKVAEGLCVHRLAAPSMGLEVAAVAALHVKALAPAEGRGQRKEWGRVGYEPEQWERGKGG